MITIGTVALIIAAVVTLITLVGQFGTLFAVSPILGGFDFFCAGLGFTVLSSWLRWLFAIGALILTIRLVSKILRGV